MSVVTRLVLVSGLWLASIGGYSLAASPDSEPSQSAHEVVRVATQRVMVIVEEAPGYVDTDPNRYYQAVHEILDPIIDFRGFARSVMGPYATGDRYRSLDNAGREELREQLEKFTEVMRIGLVATYSKGLLAFAGSRIEVSAPAAEDAGQSRVAVRQLIYSEEPQPYILMYQMGLSKARQWKLRNVIIENVNLGEIYKNQFQAAAREHDGNLDVVIENWAGVEVEG